MKICFIGEAWGEVEERERTAFCGPTGYELKQRLLPEANIHPADCFFTNVFNLRPPGNKIEAFCGSKAEAIRGYPTLGKGKYVRAEFEPELSRLADELAEINPNLIVCLGNTAMWAMLGKTTISKLRGATQISTHTIEGFKVLPTYHPAAIFRQPELRPVTVIDLMKAKREGEYPDIRQLERITHIPETVKDILDFRHQYIDQARIIAPDIETSGIQITCIGFAVSKSVSLVIPFLDTRKHDKSYWPTLAIEQNVWHIVKDILENPKPNKVFQNGLYDVAFLLRSYGIKVRGAIHDDMLLHHALQPESLKSLGFLGSVYCDLPAWKSMRQKVATIKRDE